RSCRRAWRGCSGRRRASRRSAGTRPGTTGPRSTSPTRWSASWNTSRRPDTFVAGSRSMSRRVVAALALALSLLSLGHSAAPQQKPERPGLRLPALQPGEHMAAQVRKVVDFQGLDDPKTTLIEALDQLAKVHRITFDVNERAFKAEGV